MPLAGLSGLRAYFAAAVGATAGDVLICPGGQAALAACLRGLAAPGAPVIVESPTYLGALAAARAQGLAAGAGARRRARHPARTCWPTRCSASGARLVYLQPLFANPHGATLAPERRAAVLDAVRAAGAFIVEDDAFRDLAFGPVPPPLFADDPDGHVVHVRSLTKPSAPGLRIAGADRPRPGRRAAARGADRRGPVRRRPAAGGGARARRHARVARAPAPAATRAARAPRRARRALRGRGALPEGGMNLWVPLPPGTDDRELAQRAAAAGVIVSPGRPFFAAEPPGPFLRLTFAAEPPERLAEGARRLHELLNENDPPERVVFSNRRRLVLPAGAGHVRPSSADVELESEPPGDVHAEKLAEGRLRSVSAR